MRQRHAGARLAAVDALAAVEAAVTVEGDHDEDLLRGVTEVGLAHAGTREHTPDEIGMIDEREPFRAMCDFVKKPIPDPDVVGDGAHVTSVV